MERDYNAPEPGNERRPEPKAEPIRDEQSAYIAPSQPAPRAAPEPELVQVETQRDSDSDTKSS